MADDTHHFKITFSRTYYKVDSLTGEYIIKNGEREYKEEKILTVSKSSSEVEIPTDTLTLLTCKANLVYTTFNRKVYQPNEIVAYSQRLINSPLSGALDYLALGTVSLEEGDDDE